MTNFIALCLLVCMFIGVFGMICTFNMPDTQKVNRCRMVFFIMQLAPMVLVLLYFIWIVIRGKVPGQERQNARRNQR